MKNLFQVDQRARNRLGEYTVIALDGDKMTIRYDDGIESVVGQAMQARIQDNMRIDELVAEEESVRAATKRSSSGSSSGSRSNWGRSWEGFEDTDLQEGTAGTHWRSRDSMGGAVAIALGNLVGRQLESTAPWRIAETHIYDPKLYDKKHRNAQAKMLVKTMTEGCWFGFYVERSIEPMDDNWDWTRLVSALRNDEALQTTLWEAMDEHGLNMRMMESDDNSALAIATSAPDGAVSLQHYEDGDAAGDVEIMPWPDLAAFLDKGRPGEWMNLYVVQELDCNTSLERGQALAMDAAKQMAGIWPLYKACATQA